MRTNAQLPSDWKRIPLADCGRWVSGGTPSRSNPAYWRGTIPWISAKSLKQFDLLDSDEHVSEEAAAERTTIVPKGTVLFVVRGMSLAKEFRVGVACRPVTFNQDVRGIIPNSQVDSRYLGRFLMWASTVVLSRADMASHGTMRLQSDDLQQLRIPLPPLGEQERLAAILDKADGIRRKRREANALAASLIQAVFSHEFGDVSQAACRWSNVRMEELFASSPIFGTMEVPVDEKSGAARWLDLRVINIQDRKLDFTSRKYVALPAEMIDRHEVRDGDLLLARAIGSPEHLGKCIVARPNGEKWAFDSHLMRVRFRTDVAIPEFVQGFLNSPGGRHEFLKHARRSAVQYNINTKEFARIRIPLPPREVQETYLHQLRQIQQIEDRQVREGDELDNLFDSLVQRAFQGEL